MIFSSSTGARGSKERQHLHIQHHSWPLWAQQEKKEKTEDTEEMSRTLLILESKTEWKKRMKAWRKLMGKMGRRRG